MMCLEPLLLAGYLWTVQPNKYHTSYLDGAFLNVQTCERGLGLDLKVTQHGVGALSAQYGLQITEGLWSLTVTPQAGVGYLDHHVPELASRVNFSLGFHIMAGYERYRLGVVYWHQSNAELGYPNAGLDMVAVMTGLHF